MVLVHFRMVLVQQLGQAVAGQGHDAFMGRLGRAVFFELRAVHAAATLFLQTDFCLQGRFG